MKMEPATKQRIIRNAFLSLFIYVLPIALMFLTFYFTGQRPWEKKQKTNPNSKSINKTNTLNNGNND
jgi:preprotein translocase subunit YajC